MVKNIVIADDLTGANATGVLLKKTGYKTSTIMKADDIDLNAIQDCDCITFTTDSRGLDPETAYQRVYNITKMCLDEEILIYTKRIDSTLRGNLGSETAGMLDALGDDYVAIVVPCAPASGRVTVGGHMLVNGIPLNKTEVALDPKAPINNSQVEELFKKQTAYKAASLLLQDLAKGKQYLIDRLAALIRYGIRIIIFDSITLEDIDLICEAVIESGIHFAAVDPGAFTATLAQKLIVPQNKQQEFKILAVVGSVNPVAKTQMDHLWLAQPVYNVYADVQAFLESKEQREAEIERVANDVLTHEAKYHILSIVGKSIDPEHRVDFGHYAEKLELTIEEVSEIVNCAFAEITHRILSRDNAIGGLYTCGGDITAAVCRRMNTLGISLKDEVLPLAACGQFIDGDFPGRWIVTKGGMTGEVDAINICIAKLKAILNI